MSAADEDVSYERLAKDFFADVSSPQQVTAAENVDLDQKLWAQVQEMGMSLIGIPEDLGGAGGDLTSLIAVLRAQGASSAPAPVADTQLAIWALTRAGVEIPDDQRPLAVIVGDARDSWTLTSGALTGCFHGVSWARSASHAVILLGKIGDATQLALVPLDDTHIDHGRDLASQPRDTVILDNVAVTVTAWPGTHDELRTRYTLARGALMAGAMEEISNLTRAYVREREQFGRPIGKFQSVQEHIVRLEQMATMSLVAVDRATAAIARSGSGLEVALMKILLNENARLAVRSAHQAHGAIGMTQEYRLQLLTRRLNSWLGETGSSVELAELVGAAASAYGVSNLITSPHTALENS
ncbi:acyl-CoA dehydrogenase family protein [Microbacterium profundi]|uniref:Acyl-CoA dehydrogenase family protein n=1 Tax=Microbacterium profundi TaxID=450380 RepID=A0ABV3LD68_9MICO